MLKPIVITCGERIADFSMDLDPGFVADVAISWYLQQGYPCEPEIVYFMAHVVQPGDLVVDAGANVGFFTLLLARYVGSTGSVISFEPSPNNLHKLRGNIALNKMANISVYPNALAASSKKLQFYLGRDSGQNGAWRNEVTALEQITVDAITLDAALGASVPKLIKMDIEGSEYQALQGARALLARRPKFIIMEFNVDALKAMNTSPAEIRTFMHDYGYDLYVFDQHGRFPARVPESAFIRIDRNNTNVLFAPTSDLVTEWGDVIV